MAQPERDVLLIDKFRAIYIEHTLVKRNEVVESESAVSANSDVARVVSLLAMSSWNKYR